MSSVRKTSRDQMMIALAVFPPLALLLFCVSAAAKWQSDASKIRPLLNEAFSPEVVSAPSPIAAVDLATAIPGNKREFAELYSAIDVLNSKYELMFDVLEEQVVGSEDLTQEWAVDPYVDEYLAEAGPMLERLIALDSEMGDVRVRGEIGNPTPYISSWISGRNALQLLRVEFLSAVRNNETGRALRALRLVRQLDSQSIVMSTDETLLWVAASLSTEIWSEAELDQIDQSIQSVDNWDQAWQNLFRKSQLEYIPWLLGGELADSWRPDPIHTTSAPSRRLEWFRQSKKLSSVSGIGSLASVERVKKIEQEWHRESRTGLDTTLQIPSYGQFNRGGVNSIHFAEVFARRANELRHARTAVAIAKYKVKNGSYPAALDDLAALGFPLRETLDVTGLPFYYVSDQDGCILGNAATPFPYGQGHAGNTRERNLSSILDSFRLITFR